MKYYIKKILYLLATLIGVSFLVYAAFEIIPGDPALSKLGTDATPEALAALRHEMGLDRPFIVRYLSWLLECFKGNFGVSLSYNRPVIAMIGDKLPITITLTVLSMIFTILISVPTAVLMAKYAKRTLDRTFYVADQVLMAVPSFFLGILLTYVFGMVLHWFKPGGYISYSKDFPGFISYLIMPSVAIAVPKCAMSVKLLRASILEEADKDYVRTAYSRGNSTMQVMYRHVLKNAMIPLVTFWGMAVADMIAGSIVVEQVFGIPGLGRILLTSISNRDYPVVEAVIVLIAFVVCVMSLIVDILYKRIDPRMKRNDED
jgi:ABC-type dipeptide/oligopeptide/nickel transport system permease component